MTLPFEVAYSEKPSMKSKSMKRLAVIAKPENVDKITSSLKAVGLEATIYDVKGVGIDKERVASGREVAQSSLHIIQEKLWLLW